MNFSEFLKKDPLKIVDDFMTATDGLGKGEIQALICTMVGLWARKNNEDAAAMLLEMAAHAAFAEDRFGRKV